MFLLIFLDIRHRLFFCNNFNTSHVSINRDFYHKPKSYFQISIHLMFLLIQDEIDAVRFAMKHFNTSHVSINQEWADKICKWLFSFQYISCFY